VTIRQATVIIGHVMSTFTTSRLALGPTQPPIQWVTGALSLGVKRPGRKADHSLPSSTEVKNAWSYTSTPPYVFMVLQTALRFPSVWSTETLVVSHDIFIQILFKKYIEWTHNGEVVFSAYPPISSPKLLNRFRAYLVLKVYTEFCPAILLLVRSGLR